MGGWCPFSAVSRAAALYSYFINGAYVKLKKSQQRENDGLLEVGLEIHVKPHIII